MNLPKLAVKRPIFVICIVFLMLFTGWQSFKSLPVDILPTVDIPFVTITAFYPGAGPKEVENSVTKPIEEELATLEGVKNISSHSQDSVCVVVVEFQLGVPLQNIEQRVRAQIEAAKVKFPKEVENLKIEKFNPSNQPILSIFVNSKTKSRTELTNWIDNDLKPILSTVPQVGRIEVLGGQKREIKIISSNSVLENYRLPLLTISKSIKNGGDNIPGGSILKNNSEINLRTLGQFNTLFDIENMIISFNNYEKPIHVRDIGTVIESKEKEKSRAFYGNEQGVIVQVYKQPEANTIEVSNNIKNKIKKINSEEQIKENYSLSVIQDGSKIIRESVNDVWESIGVGFVLTIIIVYFFLGSFKSTIITGFAIPNSLLGAFLLMALAGFSTNLLTLLALSLSVGLIVDDGIVVRENIFRRMESGMSPKKAAVNGAREVAMAVLASTLAIIAIFGPVGFLKGVTGQFFKEFGLVVCFAMLISLFDAMAIAPLMSAYWTDKFHNLKQKTRNPFRVVVYFFEQFQNFLELIYAKLLKKSIHFPGRTILLIILASILIASPVVKLSSGFLPPDQSSEFMVQVNMPAGTNLEATTAIAKKVDKALMQNPSIKETFYTVGNMNQELYKAVITVHLKPKKERKNKKKSSEIRDEVKEELSQIPHLPADLEIIVVPFDIVGRGLRAFALNIQASDYDALHAAANRIFAQIKTIKSLSSPSLNLKPGGQELQINLKTEAAQKLGVSSSSAGLEVKARVDGIEVGKLHEKGYEYNIKLTTNDPASLWLERKKEILVPNINFVPIDIRKVAKFTQVESPSEIGRYNRNYSARISADIAPGGGLSAALKETRDIMNAEMKTTPTLKYNFAGDSESYEELTESMTKALLFGGVFLFLVLASLYESFLISFLNIVTLPLALSGAFFALFICSQDLTLFSMIGILLLLGVATKNSILLIDTAKGKLKNKTNKPRSLQMMQDFIVEASVRRLRPILMTSLALIAGSIPVAVGLNEASAQRTGMGIAIIGGVITSTLFTLLLVPSMLILVEKAKMFIRERKMIE